MNPYSGFSWPVFDRFLVWLSTTDLRLFIYRFEDIHPLVRFAHVTGAGILIGSILLVDLRLVGLGRRVPATDLARLALPWSIGGAVAALATGVLMLLFDPIAVGVHTFFLPKMALIVVGLLNAVVFHRFGKIAAVEGTRHLLRARIAGLLSMVLWLGVFLCATLNASERVFNAVTSGQNSITPAAEPQAT